MSTGSRARCLIEMFVVFSRAENQYCLGKVRTLPILKYPIMLMEIFQIASCSKDFGHESYSFDLHVLCTQAMHMLALVCPSIALFERVKYFDVHVFIDAATSVPTWTLESRGLVLQLGPILIIMCLVSQISLKR